MSLFSTVARACLLLWYINDMYSFARIAFNVFVSGLYCTCLQCLLPCQLEETLQLSGLMHRFL